MSTHLDLSRRNTILLGIESRKPLSLIAAEIGVSPSTVSRELRKHRSESTKSSMGRIPNRCAYRFSCSRRSVCSNIDCSRKCSACNKCNHTCPAFVEEFCDKLNHPPYVCNGCDARQKCTLRKFFYDPRKAQADYRSVLVESRSGFNLSDNELASIDAFISPLVRNGQSLHAIYSVNKHSISVSERTLNRLLDSNMLSVRNIDLPRKCSLKPRKGKQPERKLNRNCRVGRTFSDYLRFISEHPDVHTVQIDSVIGSRGGKVLLTMCFHGDLMLAFLREHNDAQSVIQCFNDLYSALGHELFCKLFPVILTDNGSEFSDPDAIEFAPNGTRRSHLFYCDPCAPYQKPDVERCHELLRRILPSGKSFDALSQEHINLALSHVNSYPKKSLGDKSPFDSFSFFFGDKALSMLLHLLCLKVIPPNDIILKPYLLLF